MRRQWEPPQPTSVGHKARPRRHSDSVLVGQRKSKDKSAKETTSPPSFSGRQKRHSLTHIDLLAQLPHTPPELSKPLTDHVKEHGSPRSFGTASAPPARPPPRADPGYPQTRQVSPPPPARRSEGASPGASARSPPVLLHIPRRENNQRGFAPEPSDRDIVRAVMAAHEKKQYNPWLQSGATPLGVGVSSPPGSQRSRRASLSGGSKQGAGREAAEKDGGAGSVSSPTGVVSAVLW